jgi:anti-sigma factor RsiW
VSDRSLDSSPEQELDQDLSALLDGELDENQARSLRERIRNEPALAERFAVLGGLDETLRGLGTTSHSSERVTGVRAELQRRMDAESAEARGEGEGEGLPDAAGPGIGDQASAPVLTLRRQNAWMLPLGAALAAGLVLYLSVGPSPDPPPESAVPEAPGEGHSPGLAAVPSLQATPLDSASDEDLAIALEYETLADYEVIEQLDMLELIAAMDQPM